MSGGSVFAICAAVALLVGCGGSQPSAGATSAVPQGRAIDPDGATNGMYVSEFFGSEILGYAHDNRRGRAPSCTIPGVSYVNDLAVDAKGNLVVPDGGSRTIKVFQGPEMCGPELGAVADPYGQPSDASSADAATGTMVVANQFDGPPSQNNPGSISLCSLKHGCTANLTNPKIFEVGGVAQATNGDCWASGEPHSGAAKLIYFKGCAGSGRAATGFENQYYGGLDIDDRGDLVSISYGDAQLYVYKGCNPACKLVAGPFRMRRPSFFGHLNERSTKFAAVDNEYVQVDVYAYSPTSLRYVYSFSGVSESNDLGGVAFNPRSKE